MFKVNKTEEPQFFRDYKKRNTPKSWKDFSYDIKRQLKEYMLENEYEYKNEEGSYCPYCELKINLENSQIEHIYPKDKFPEKLMEYSNYLVACISPVTCGQNKGNSWENYFINPTIEDPEKYLEYNLSSGEIIPKEKDESKLEYKKAKLTIDLLNLNQKKLRDIRKKIILECLGTLNYVKDYDQFPTLRNQIIRDYNL